jgi:putative DNA primase/helicase
MERETGGSLRERRKYLGAPGGRNHLYFPCGIGPEALADVSLPVIVTEGEKKALALRRLAGWDSDGLRFFPVGLSGVWNWRGAVGREPGPFGDMRKVKGAIPDLDRIAWKGRAAFVLFDSDRRRNPSIRASERALAGELKSRGAVVRLVDLPDLPGFDKTGADDFLAHRGGGPERLLALIDGAVCAEPGSAGEILARAGIPELTAQSGIDEVEAALRRLRREMAGVDSLRETAVRSETVRHLQDIGVQAPAQLAGAALSQHQDAQEGTRRIAFPEPEPWPHPVSGFLLLEEIASVLRRFVVLPLPETRAVALWIVHTYAVEATSICPILVIRSPEKRCGKTLLLELLLNLAFRPLPASNITSSSLFRAIERYRPTLLLDEADTFLCGSDELRGVINSGYRRSSSYVIRTVGDDFEPVVFDTFGPKAVAQIGTPPETILDRGVIVEMRRKTPDEKVERLRSDRASEELLPLRRKAARWAKDNIRRLKDCEPSVPQELNDRAQDSWRPLLAIAELAGAQWVEYGRASAVRLSEGKGEVSTRTLLLADIREIFRQAGTTRMASADICARLGDMEEHPWPELRNGQPITVRQLARLLEPLGVGPRQFRITGEVARGYELGDFEDSFARYLPGTAPDSPSR